MDLIETTPPDLQPVAPSAPSPARSRARWEDYLPAQTRTGPQPIRSTLGVLDLETGREAPAVPADAATEIAQPTAAQPGPFEIPDVQPAKRVEPTMSRLKLVAVAFFGGIWAALAVAPAPKAPAMAVVESFAAVPAGSYARYGAAALGDLPIRWMGRFGSTVLAEATPAWKGLPKEAKVEVLQQINRIAEQPAELLLMSADSALLAETFDGRYHLYE